MKSNLCNLCGKEYSGTTCPYCGEKLIEEEVKTTNEEIKERKIVLILSLFSLTVAIGANFFKVLMILAIISSIATLVITIKTMKKYYSTPNKYINLLILSIISCIIMIVPTIGETSRFISRLTASKEYEKILNINIPSKIADEYNLEIGYDTNVRLVTHSFTLTKDEYSKMLENNDVDWINNENKDNDQEFFIDLINNDSGNFLIYDRERQTFTTPISRLKYYFILVNIKKVDNSYYLYIYDIMKREY